MTTQILPAIAAIIFNREREVLLQHRRDVGQWGIISGHVEFGERVADAVLREIWEETSSHAEIVRLIGIYSSPHSQTYEYGDKTVQYVTTYFEARFIEEPNLQFHTNETGALKFFAPHELPEPLAQMHGSWLQDALASHEVPFLR